MMMLLYYIHFILMLYTYNDIFLFFVDSKSKLNLRPYQQRVLDAALTKNTLAFLPTGAGRHTCLCILYLRATF